MRRSNFPVNAAVPRRPRDRPAAHRAPPQAIRRENSYVAGFGFGGFGVVIIVAL
jgi:hypothetical protein